MEKLKAFPLRSKTRQGCQLSPFSFNILLEVLRQEIDGLQGEQLDPYSKMKIIGEQERLSLPR